MNPLLVSLKGLAGMLGLVVLAAVVVGTIDSFHRKAGKMSPRVKLARTTETAWVEEEDGAFRRWLKTGRR